MNHDFILVASHKFYLAEQIADRLGKELVIPQITVFADGEKDIIFADTSCFTNKKVVIVHPTCPPVAEEIIVLSLMAGAIHYAGSKELVALISYLGYARHNKITMEGIPPAAQTIIRLLEAIKIDRFMCVGLHDEQEKAFFTKPVQSVDLISSLAEYIQKQVSGDYCIVAPDHGAHERARAVAALVGRPVIYYTKKRIAADATVLEGAADFSLHEKAIIIDDIIDTGGTALQVAGDLTMRGFKEIYGCFIHGIFSKKENIPLIADIFKKIFVSNSVPLSFQHNKIEIFDISQALLPFIESE